MASFHPCDNDHPLSRDEDGMDVDPRVKEELEILNTSSVEINKLERELEHARDKFKSLSSEYATRLNTLAKNLGKCVQKARPYFELYKDAQKQEAALQQATLRYQRANSMSQAAKETVGLAEERISNRDGTEPPDFDEACQEMMNHANAKYQEAVREQTKAEEDHGVQTGKYTRMKKELTALDKDLPRSIARSRPYFELKDSLEFRLQQERLSFEDLQRALTAAKDQYRTSLATLEEISDEIHRQRKQRSPLLLLRTPGVGAEADQLSINLETRSLSGFSLQGDSEVSSLCSQDLVGLLESPQMEYFRVPRDGLSPDGSSVKDLPTPELVDPLGSLPVSASKEIRPGSRASSATRGVTVSARTSPVKDTAGGAVGGGSRGNLAAQRNSSSEPSVEEQFVSLSDGRVGRGKVKDLFPLLQDLDLASRRLGSQEGRGGHAAQESTLTKTAQGLFVYPAGVGREGQGSRGVDAVGTKVVEDGLKDTVTYQTGLPQCTGTESPQCTGTESPQCTGTESPQCTGTEFPQCTGTGSLKGTGADNVLVEAQSYMTKL